jgi:hypothetical protein
MGGVLVSASHQEETNLGLQWLTLDLQNKFRGFSPQTNYTDWAIAACRRS